MAEKAIPIPASEWKWCGLPGHFIGASSCVLHLHTRIGRYRISTVGDYRPRGEERQEIGCDRLYETMVFLVSGRVNHGMGEFVDLMGLDFEGYNDGEDACKGHMKMCKKYARKAGKEKAKE